VDAIVPNHLKNHAAAVRPIEIMFIFAA